MIMRYSAVIAAVLLAQPLAATAIPSDEHDDTSHGTAASKDESARASYGPQETVDRAVVAVGKMRQDPRLSELLGRAHGVLILPHYVKAAAVVGGGGGDGVLLLRRSSGNWSDPAFYKVGGGSVGAQLGAEEGTLALLLMNDKAVQAFEEHASKWSLTGNAGLTVVEYSASAGKSLGEGDIVAWSDTKGLFGGVAVGARDVRRDDKANQAYYGDKSITTQQILSGKIHNPHASNAALLKDQLALKVAAK